MANRYTSENFWSLQRFEEYYAGDKITSKKIGDAFRSLNRQYSKLISRIPRIGGVKNYVIWREDMLQAKFLSDELEKKYGRGIIKNINDKTGEVEFYHTGYGIYSSDDRIRILAMRDYVASNWAISPAYFEEYKKESYSVNSKNVFLRTHKDITLDEYENFQSIFSLKIWQDIRRKVPYDIEEFKDLVKNVNTYVNSGNDFDIILQVLGNSSSVQDFNSRVSSLIASHI